MSADLSFRSGNSVLFRAGIFCLCLTGLTTFFNASARAAATLEERKLPMRFTWAACEPNCRGWIGAVGIVTADTPKDFENFARDHDLKGATVVLDSSGGSVNDAITLGRHWRKLGLATTVGITTEMQTAAGKEEMSVSPEAYCESMCVFLLLAGKTRYVPEEAHVRVHQIWMGDRADDPRAASYTAQDLMIVERDIGRLAKYTFDMGGAGDLLSLSLNVPPWDELHELTLPELKLTNIVTTDTVADVLPPNHVTAPDMAELGPKSVTDRFVSDPDDEKSAEASPGKSAVSAKSTKTAEATVPTGGVAASAAPK